MEKGEVGKEAYLEERREWKKFCRDKEEEQRRMLVKQVRSLEEDKDIWYFFNKDWKRRVRIGNNISKEEWRKHFKIHAKESESVVKGQGRKNRGEKGSRGWGILREEIKLAWKRLKKKKALGIDGIPNEVLMYVRRGLT